MKNRDASIKILDVQGHLIKAFQPQETETQFALPQQKGIYLLSVSAGTAVETTKVVSKAMKPAWRLNPQNNIQVLRQKCSRSCI